MTENDISRIIVNTSYDIHVKLGPGLLESIYEEILYIELKSVEKVIPVHYKQLLTYLKVMNFKLGLLINFNENLIKNGII